MMKPFRAAAALLLLAFALNLQPSIEDTRFPIMPSAARVSAQISFCGVCCDADTACWEKRRTDFERAYPPRGALTGVCWSSDNKWERDPTTGEQVMRFQNPVFSRVRFDETEVLSSEHHGRNAGFEFTVGHAWVDFVNANLPPTAAGWNRASLCVSLSSPRSTEIKQWEKEQEKATYQRVFLPTYGIADTPEERAAEARAAKERAARDAEKARLAAVEKAKQDAIEAEKRAEAARKAEAARIEAARVEAERQRRISAMQEQLGGPGKRAAAERLAAENEALKALRPKPPAKPPAAKPRLCTTRNFSSTLKRDGQTQAEATARVARDIQMKTVGGLGAGESWVSVTASGAPSCKQEKLLQMLPNPPVGNCLNCISEQMAANMFGWVKGKGYPPPKTEWICTASYQGVAEKCGTNEGSKVSRE